MSALASVPVASDVDGCKSINNLVAAVRKIDVPIDALLDHEFLELCESLQSMEKAKLFVSLAYVLSTLYFLLLKSRGANATESSIHSELARIKKYVEKVNKAAADGGTVKDKESVESGSARILTVDKMAAKRIVHNELGKRPSASMADTAVLSDKVVVSKKGSKKAKKGKK